MLNLSPAAVTKLKKQGMPVHSLEAAQAWRVARQNVAARKPMPGERVRSPGTPDGSHLGAPLPPGDAEISIEDRDAARTRREVAEANIAELEEARLRRELITVRVVQDRLAHDFATTRDALLQLPSRMGPVLAAETDPAAVERLLYAEIHAALMHLAGAAEALPAAAASVDV